MYIGLSNLLEMKKLVALFFAALMVSTISNAQQKTCTTDEHQHELEKEFTWLKDKRKAYEAIYRQGLKMINSDGLNKTEDNHLDTTTQYKIALVFHIVHTYNDEGTDWISDQRVFDCMESVNHHWNGSYLDTAEVAPYYKDKVGNGHVTFVLANKDPYGNCTNGIDRIHSYTAVTGGTRAKINQWPPDKYINIWVAQDAGSPGALAYAIPVSSADAFPYLDGVMTSQDGVRGRPSSNSSTIAHEIAHVLNISHVWGSTNSPEVGCGDDDVVDTAPTKGNSPQIHRCSDSAFINKQELDCWDTNINLDYAMYYNDPLCTSPVQNIMDYSYCHLNFTHGQMKRARATLQNFYGLTDNANRENLITEAAHIYAGIDGTPVDCDPIADFHSESRFGLQGNQTYVVRNFTYNTPLTGITYKWSSPNSTPNTSTSATSFFAKFPNNDGWQSIELEASRAGKVGTTTKSEYIFVQKPGANNAKQTFEDDARNYYWPTINYYDNQFKWEVTDMGAYWGDKCIKYSGYDGRTYPASNIADAAGDFDDFFTEVIQIGASNQKLNFWLAGAALGTDAQRIGDDELEISFTNNGGTTWIPFERIQGADLYPNGAYAAGEFTPGGWWDYTPVTVDLPSSMNNKEVIFRFRMKPGIYANNVYLDDIEVSDLPTGIRDQEDGNFVISPNPLFDNKDLVITGKNSLKDAEIVITDLTGRVIFESQVSDNNTTTTVQRENFPSQGLYIITISQEGSTYSQKVSVL